MLTITDNMHNEFVDWVKQQKFKYNSPLLITLNEVKKATLNDKQNTDLQNRIKSLETAIEKHETSDLFEHKNWVKHILTQQIAFHLHLTTGLATVSLPKDPLFIQAKVLASDSTTLAKILSAK
jgi:hypothetical protein